MSDGGPTVTGLSQVSVLSSAPQKIIEAAGNNHWAEPNKKVDGCVTAGTARADWSAASNVVHGTPPLQACLGTGPRLTVVFLSFSVPAQEGGGVLRAGVAFPCAT